MTKDISHPDYRAFLTALKQRIVHARTTAARVVNRELALLYWDIGRAIVEKQQLLGWGESVIDRLSADLQDSFPRATGFSPRNLRDMKRFYLAYSDETNWRQGVANLAKHQASTDNPIWRQPVAKLKKPSHTTVDVLRQLVAQVPWGQHLQILNKITDPAARLYYLRATAQLGWSRNVLLNQIKARAYQRAAKEKKTNNFVLALPKHFAEQADEMMKSSYNLEFLGINRPMKERGLENRLVERLQHFILELGYGFCFVSRQYRLSLGRKEYFVDLLFYHRFLKALVAIDLKIGAFEPEHSGKMDFYLNLLNEKERGPGDRPSIGIILCAEKEDIEIEFALKTKANPIGVAEYQLKTSLPAEFKGRMPTAKQLADVMRAGLPLPQAVTASKSSSKLAKRNSQRV